MKKYVCLIAVLALCVTLLAGCGCKHEWMAANCTDPKTCELCGLTEGEAKGHNWEEATCIIPKKCSLCHATEGEALSHNWAEATTEAPKTCTNCQATEGTAIQTDPRFTTAATQHLHGTWTCDVVLTGEMLGLPGYFESLPCTLIYKFGKAGEATLTVELHDNLAFLEELKRFTTDLMIETMAAQGIPQSQLDAAMQEAYGMTLSEYVDITVESIDKDEIFEGFTSDGVYYVGQNGIYMSESWYDEFECSEYTLEDGVLTIEQTTLEEDGEPLQWTKKD